MNKAGRPIVVAESNFLTARLISATLQGTGHATAVGRFGDEVLRLIDRHHPAVLVLNMNLARPSGLEFLRMLQQRNIRMNILAAVAPGQPELRAAAASLGVADFFEIPFSPEDLASRVETLNSTWVPA